MPQKKNRVSRSRRKEREDMIVLEVARHGPLPHPSLLEDYNQLTPDAGERILRMAEEESRHRHSLELADLNSRIEQREWRAMERRIGQILGLILGLSTLGAGTWMVFAGREAVGTTIVLSGLGFLITASLLRNDLASRKREAEK